MSSTFSSPGMSSVKANSVANRTAIFVINHCIPMLSNCVNESILNILFKNFFNTSMFCRDGFTPTT